MLSIDNYRNHFLTKKFDYKYKHHSRHKKNNLSNDFDKLFFNFLIIINYDIPFNYNKHIEKNIKYEMSQKMENIKIKKKEDIVNNMCFDLDISLFTLFALAEIHQINLMYHNETIFHASIKDESGKVFVVNSKKDIYVIKPEKVQHILDSCMEISDLFKPYYSMSHYKLNDLIENLEKLKINLSFEVKYKKADYYDMFVKHLNKLLI